MAIRLLRKNSGAHLGDISREDLQLLVDKFEEESSRDQDYFVNAMTIDMLQEAGASEHLLTLLREAVGPTDGTEIRWEDA
jgi:hypothetical protein